MMTNKLNIKSDKTRPRKQLKVSNIRARVVDSISTQNRNSILTSPEDDTYNVNKNVQNKVLPFILSEQLKYEPRPT